MTQNRCCFLFAWLSFASFVALAVFTVIVARPPLDDAERLKQLESARQEIMLGKKGDK